MAQKTKKYRNVANPERAAAMHALGSSSAASPQETRAEYKRPRKVSRKAAINSGW
jgi:hypothetical protein